MDLFTQSFASSSDLDRYCLAGFNVPPGGGRLARFFRLVAALKKTIDWCERHAFLDKLFIIREFSTWALILAIGPAFRARRSIGFNINHNLVGRASYLVTALISRFVPIYYLAGRAHKHGGIPAHVRIIDISSAYPAGVPQRSTGPCVVLLPRRGDQHLWVPVDELAEAVSQATHDVEWIGLDPSEPALPQDAYRSLIARASCVVLAYHQGILSARHSGVIWDALLARKMVFVPSTAAFLAQAGPAVEKHVVAYRSAGELTQKLQSVLS